MRLSIHRRLTLVWLLLSAVTVASWLLGSARGRAEFSPSNGVTIGVVVAAAVKSRFIVQQFMEARCAPTWLTAVTDGWLVALVGSVLALYLW